MVFDEGEGKECEGGYYKEIINTSSLIPTCSLHDNGKGKDAKSSEKEEIARVARLRSRRKAGQLTSEKRRHQESTMGPLDFTYKKPSLYFTSKLASSLSLSKEDTASTNAERKDDAPSTGGSHQDPYDAFNLMHTIAIQAVLTESGD